MQSRLPLLLSSILLLACAPGFDDVADSDTGSAEDALRALTIYIRPSPSFRPGSTWGPCNPDDAWGCDGELGSGDACLRPVPSDELSLCAPQTWDPLIDDDCNPDGIDLVDPGFGLGVRVNGSAYCVPDCVTDADCGAGRRCSPASHFCAWVDANP